MLLTPLQLQQIQTHAERTYPEEGCGILLGTRQADFCQLVEVIETHNAWDDAVAAELQSLEITPSKQTIARCDRYWIAPQDLLQAQRYARDRQLDIIGIYHTHPDHAAVPSETDRMLAWAEYLYVIVSVQQGKVSEVRCWQLDDQQQFQAKQLIIDQSIELQQ